jgi:hypothetical protein
MVGMAVAAGADGVVGDGGSTVSVPDPTCAMPVVAVVEATTAVEAGDEVEASNRQPDNSEVSIRSMQRPGSTRNRVCCIVEWVEWVVEVIVQVGM